MIEPTVSATAQIRPLREEIASALIQGGAAVASAVGFVYRVTRAWRQQNALGVASIVVYGAAMLVAFAAASRYHGVQQARIKPVLRAIDQCTILRFIGGTFTLLALLPLRHLTGGILLASIWILAIAGIVPRLSNDAVFRRADIPLDLATGWLCLGWIVPVYQTAGIMPGSSHMALPAVAMR
jgi:hemolysin III